MIPKVITFHYTLTDKKGNKLDSSREQNEPMMFMTGSGHIIPGLERQIETLGKGEKKTVVVAPSEGYGEFDQQLIMDVNRDRFPADAKIKVGDRFQAGSREEPGPVFTVTNVTDKAVTVDGNHPLAGQELTFDVEIMESRAATADEIEHGHAHGPDGHHHH